MHNASKEPKEPYVCKLNEHSISNIKNTLKLLLPYLSNYLNSTQLTLCTLLWSFLIILAGYLSRNNQLWLLLSIFALLGHVVTDLLDGEMSLYQNDGLEKWNFFMDHLLDFVLAIAIFIGLLLQYYKKHTHILFPLFAIFILIIINMAASFLLIAEKGLDLGIKVHECLTFNIFHMHIILIVFYLINIVFKKKINAVYIWILTVMVGVITIYNIYKKQQELRHQ
jgi:phosphatidylglycerophosphate synthase